MHTFALSASLDGATLSTQFLGDRVPPQRPERLRTVVGNEGDNARNSSSASALGVDMKGECRSYQIGAGVEGPSVNRFA
jgi:hypothetical protein